MIIIVERSSRAQFARQVEEMQCLRHRGSIGRVGWLPASRWTSPYIDEFDTTDAIYVLDLDGHGLVLSGLRLLCTTGPHLIAQRFSDRIFNNRMATGPFIYELSQYFAIGSGTPVSAYQCLCALFCAVFEFCISRGWTHISMVCDIEVLPSLLRLGWEALPLGIPFSAEHRLCVPIIVSVGDTALAMKTVLEAEGESIFAELGAASGHTQ